MSLDDLISESNSIEMIFEPFTEAEKKAYVAFKNLHEVEIKDLVDFVNVIQPEAKLRDKCGLDVKVGDFYPMKGCPEIRTWLDTLLWDANSGFSTPYEVHHRYEAIHPFTDGNGRSGRLLWYWQMLKEGKFLGETFLQTWYYQSLE